MLRLTEASQRLEAHQRRYLAKKDIIDPVFLGKMGGDVQVESSPRIKKHQQTLTLKKKGVSFYRSPC